MKSRNCPCAAVIWVLQSFVRVSTTVHIGVLRIGALRIGLLCLQDRAVKLLPRLPLIRYKWSAIERWFFFLCVTETEVIRYAFFCADKGNCLNLEKVKVTPHRNWHLPSPRLFPLSGCVIRNHKGHDLADSGHVSTSGLKLYHICYASLIKRDFKKNVLNVIWLVWTSWKFLSSPKKENSTCLLT